MIRSKIAPHVARAKRMGFVCTLLTLALHLCPGIVTPAHAQGSRKDDIVFNSRGIPLAGATVRVCAMPASGQPCTPLAQIYSDAALTQALANPTTTDGLGNYFFYAAPGKYELEISGPGITTKQLANIILPNDPSSPTFSSLSSSGAISAFSLNLTGNLTVNGSTTVLGNLASGTLNLTNQSTTPGAASSGSVNLYTKAADKKLYYKDDAGTEQGPLGAGVQANAPNTFTAAQNFDADTHTKGPNPWFDMTRYGGYTSNAPPTMTCSISSGSTILNCTTNPDFQNGQGVVVPKAGPATALTTPGQPTVTPVNLLNGSTTYTYQLIAEDRTGGLTAAGLAGSTTSGAATLGANTISLISCVRSNGVATYTSGSNHNLQAGAQVSIGGFASTINGACVGTKTIASTPTATTFTVNDGVNSPNETVNASGSAVVIACNVLAFANSSYSGNNTIHYWVYRNNALAGVAVGVDPWFQDCGGPAPSAPSYVPSAPPGSAQPGYLATTISSGGGTTTLTLVNAASSSVTSQIVLHDNSKALLAAIQAAASSIGGTAYIPNAGGSQWPFNATADFSTVSNPANSSLRIHVNSNGVQLNQPWIFVSGMDIEGEPHGTASFNNVNGSLITGTANPMFLMPVQGANNVHLSRIMLSGGSPQQVPFLSDSGQSGGGNAGLVMDDTVLSGSVTGPALLIKGGFDFFIERGICGTPGAAAFNGGSCARLTNVSPAVSGASPSQIPGRVRFDQWYMSGNAVSIDCMPNSFVQAAAMFTFREILFESVLVPFLRINCPTGNFGTFALDRLTTADSIAGFQTPLVDAQRGGVFNGGVFCNGCNAGAGAPPFFISNNGTNGRDIAFFYNTNVVNPGNTLYEIHGGGTLSNSYNIANLMEFPMATPTTAPNAVVSAGGSAPIGSLTYAVQFLDVNGNASALSPSSTPVTTSSGNQTVTVTQPASSPAGAVSWLLYRNNNGSGFIRTLCAAQPLSTTSVIDNVSCGNSVLPNTAGASTMSTNGLSTPALTVVDGSGFTFKTNFPNSLTANRTLSLPDANVSFQPGSGPVLLSGALQSNYDNFNRANGAIGSNWTVTNNGLNVVSNAIQGTTANANNNALWSAGSSAVSVPQFAQLVVASLNGTTDDVGPAVLVSSTGSGQGYACLENATTLFIDRFNGNSNSSIATTSVTGAVGDVIRLEYSGAGALTCYRNGVSALTATDTTFTAGSPGLFLFGNVATAENWSGGNLHALAQLDAEQDWVKLQHFLQGMTLGAETLSASPRAEQNVFLPGALTSTWTGATWTLDKAVTVTRVQVQAKTAPSGCTTNAVVRLTDGSTPVNVTVSSAANDSGALSQNYSAGAALTVAAQTAAAGCTTSPADANVVIQYRMQ